MVSIPFHSPPLPLQLGPNADVKKWEEEQIGITTVRFGAKDANKVSVVIVTSTAVAACESHCQ